MKDVTCPYCGEEQEINHDDGYGYEEDQKHQQECGKCEKTFVYTTSISFYYEAEKCPCLNDGEHDWKPINGWPEEHFKNKRRCSYCDEETTVELDGLEKKECLCYKSHTTDPISCGCYCHGG